MPLLIATATIVKIETEAVATVVGNHRIIETPFQDDLETASAGTEQQLPPDVEDIDMDQHRGAHDDRDSSDSEPKQPKGADASLLSAMDLCGSRSHAVTLRQFLPVSTLLAKKEPQSAALRAAFPLS